MRWIIQGFKLLSPAAPARQTGLVFGSSTLLPVLHCVFWPAGCSLTGFGPSGMASQGPGNVQTAQGPGAGAVGVAMVHNIYVCAAHRGFREILKVIYF
jgi:hypothetical protein